MMWTFDKGAIARTAIFLAMLCFWTASAGQVFLSPPDRVRAIVKIRISRLPKEIHLSASQRKRLVSALEIATAQEDHVLRTVSGRFRQRLAIGVIARRLQSIEKTFLTPRQFRLLDRPAPPLQKKL